MTSSCEENMCIPPYSIILQFVNIQWSTLSDTLSKVINIPITALIPPDSSHKGTWYILINVEHLMFGIRTVMFTGTSWRLESPATRLFVQPLAQASKFPHRPFWGKSARNWWMYVTKGQLCTKSIHAITSSCQTYPIPHIENQLPMLPKAYVQD